MNILSKMFFAVVLVASSSCNAIISKALNHRPDNDEFKYYQSETLPEINKNLNTKSFYYTGSGVYQYLSFHDDGFVCYYGGTAVEPGTIVRSSGSLKPERKKSGQPKDIMDDFGFFITQGDSVKLTIHKLGVLGSQSLFEYKGLIYSDSLVFDLYQLPVYETDVFQNHGQQVFYLYKK